MVARRRFDSSIKSSKQKAIWAAISKAAGVNLTTTVSQRKQTGLDSFALASLRSIPNQTQHVSPEMLDITRLEKSASQA